MPSATSLVGALTLPVAAGTAQQRIADPVLDALLDFLAWSLGTDLSARLAQLTGTGATAVPTANRYAHDPQHPRGRSIRFQLPALFMWWGGQSTIAPYSTLRTRRERELSALYIFDELPGTDETVRREGLFAAADACFAKAAQGNGHPSYGYGSAAAGTPLTQSVGGIGSWAWRYIGGATVQRIGIDDASTGNVRRGAASGRDFPAFAARFLVHELVAGPTLADPGDVLSDLQTELRANDDASDDFAALLTRYDAPQPPV